MRTRPSPLPHREELALARRVIDAYADKVLKEGDLNDKVRTLEALARVEPERVLAEAEKGKFPDPFYNDMFRMRVVEGMAHDDPDAAAEVAESIQVAHVPVAWPTSRSSTRSTRSPENRARRVELLDQALLHARGMKEGRQAAAPAWGRSPTSWLELGETDKATRAAARGGEGRPGSCRTRPSRAMRGARSPRSWRRSTSTPRWP